MFKSKFGSFNGGSWEALCQQVFKSKYLADGYQQIPASPGDFGLEGFTVKTGKAFQCYCPEKHYERAELYAKQRDKITQDLNKLNTYKNDITKIVGNSKIKEWIFVTPEIDRHALLAHARTKEKEVISWGLPFIDNDFTILLYDGDMYLVEINSIRCASGEALVFDEFTPVISEITGEIEEFEKNILRKSQARLQEKNLSERFSYRVKQLQQITLENFLEGDGYFRRIESSAPTLYIKLARLINEYENKVVETSASWTGTPAALTEKIREGLESCILSELAPELNATHASQIARHMISRWIAICELDYE